MKFILGKKIGMGQIFDAEGNAIPITLIEAGPCVVTQVKDEKKDGYRAIQIGFERIKKQKKIKKTMRGKEFRWLREYRNGNDYRVGDEITVSVFTEGDRVKISGVSKGKGFQGVVKRWGFSGRDATHGVKHEHRTLGSVGATGPQRVFKGKKMPGRTGFQRVTVKNLKVVKVDAENNLLAVQGAVPGTKGTPLEIKGEK